MKYLMTVNSPVRHSGRLDQQH